MRRALFLVTIFVAALATARAVSAAPQSRHSATLSGVVLGPDVSRLPNCGQTITMSAHPAKAFFPNGKRTSACVPGRRKR
jgi:hypothetical protein